jgi:hypothetical protein
MSLPSVRSSAITSSAGRKRIVTPFCVETLQNSHGYGHPRIVWTTWKGTYFFEREQVAPGEGPARQVGELGPL